MNSNQMKKEQAITLVALVITVIVMLILAGVAISLTIGENGIFKKSQEGAQIYQNSANKETSSLGQLDEEMGDFVNTYYTQLPENTPENPQKAGTEVKMPTKWYSTTPANVSTEDGSIIKKVEQVASVTAIATGNGETLPVPKGFYYVGGTLEEGAVISDHLEDQNKYVGKTDVGKDLEGNQFVWVPCTSEAYKKTEWGTTYQNIAWDPTTPTSEKIQVQKYRRVLCRKI